MKFARPSLITLFAVLALPCLAEENITPAPVAEAAQETAPAINNKTGTTGSRIEVSGPTSHVSRNLSASITSALPKYQPPAPVVANTEQDPALEEATEIEDPDNPAAEGQPRNKIIRLPKVVVEANRSPVFRDKDINTKKGLSKIAAKKYISTLDKSLLNRFTIPLIGMTPEQRALQMYEEQERLDNIQDLKEQANNAARAGESSEAKALRREVDRTYIRSGGMDWTMPKD